MGKEFVALIDVVPEEIDIDFEEFVGKLKAALPDTCTIKKYDVIDFHKLVFLC